MKISVKEVKPCRRRIKVEIPASEVLERFDRFWKEISRKAQVPGFRAGKAPREVLQKHFSDRAEKEVIQELVSDGYRNAIREKGIHPVAYPQISEVKHKQGEPFQFEAQVDVRPEFKLKDYKGLPLDRKPVEVTDEDVDKTLEALRKRQAQFIDAGTRPVGVTDFVVMDYKCRVNGKVEEERKNYGLEVGHEHILPALRTGLVGLKTGDTKTIDVEFPKNYERKEWAGQKGAFEVTLKEVKEPRLPKLDDDFVKSISSHQTVSELKESVRKNTLSQKQHAAREAETGQVIDGLLKQFSFEVPESVRLHQEQNLWRETEERLMRGGWSKERIEKETPQLKEKIKGEATQQVRFAYLVDAIAEAEKITVDEKEVNEAVNQSAAQAGVDPERLRKSDKGQHLNEQFADRLVREKVIHFLVKHAQVKETSRIIKP